VSAPSPLAARGLRKSFGGVDAVTEFTVEVTPGIVTGLIGPNGAGKTTIFNMLSGRIKPDAGDVWFYGELVTGKPMHWLSRRGLGRSFQEVRLFPSLTVLENAALYAQGRVGNSLASQFVTPVASFRENRRALKAAQTALDFVGLGAIAGARADSLAYAEQKLLSVARLLAMGAEVFLLDEPASGLDKHGIEVVISTIARLVEAGKTVVLIEHNLDVVRAACDRIVFLDQGSVRAEGTAEEVFSRTELATIYFGA
jgi:ABC-type branched-subunit amino acid transport system ATPase component